MSSVTPGTPSGNPSERAGNGSLGSGGPSSPGAGSTSPPPGGASHGVGAGSGMSAGPTGPGTFPDPVGSQSQGSRSWTRSDPSHRSEFGAFLDDLSELARGGSGQGDLRGELERRVSQARGRMSEALDHGMEMTARARDQMRRGLDYSRDTVTERPLSSLMVAAIGGLIIGLLMSRRD